MFEFVKLFNLVPNKLEKTACGLVIIHLITWKNTTSWTVLPLFTHDQKKIKIAKDDQHSILIVFLKRKFWRKILEKCFKGLNMDFIKFKVQQMVFGCKSLLDFFGLQSYLMTKISRIFHPKEIPFSIGKKSRVKTTNHFALNFGDLFVWVTR